MWQAKERRYIWWRKKENRNTDQEHAAKILANKEHVAKALADQEHAAKILTDEERVAKALTDQECAAKILANQERAVNALADQECTAKDHNQDQLLGIAADDAQVTNGIKKPHVTASIKSGGIKLGIQNPL